VRESTINLDRQEQDKKYEFILPYDLKMVDPHGNSIITHPNGYTTTVRSVQASENQNQPPAEIS